jgi:Flp pilus assembly protein TadD
VQAGLLNTHGMALWKLGEKTRAEGELKKAIAADPGFDRPYLNLSRLLAEQGKNREAAAVLGALLQLAPGHQQAAEMIQRLQSSKP